MDIIAAHTGRADWADWRGSVGWQARNLRGVEAPLRWSIPLFANGGTLADGAAHRYDDYYREAARTLASAYPGKTLIVVRTGEEFNGDWMPWRAAGKERLFSANYRNFVTAFRSVSTRFRFEWNVNFAKHGADVVRAYPGDGYVDYVGMDFYWDSTRRWSITDPIAAFEDIRTAKYGLLWLENFAAAHGKPSAYSEWGVNSARAGPFVELTKRWFDAHRVAYAIYWDSNSDFAGKLSDGGHGPPSATYRRLFAGCGS